MFYIIIKLSLKSVLICCEYCTILYVTLGERVMKTKKEAKEKKKEKGKQAWHESEKKQQK